MGLRLELYMDEGVHQTIRETIREEVKGLARQEAATICRDAVEQKITHMADPDKWYVADRIAARITAELDKPNSTLHVSVLDQAKRAIDAYIEKKTNERWTAQAIENVTKICQKVFKESLKNLLP